MSIDKLKLAKGYIMHKMYHYNYVGGKHTPLDRLCKGGPIELAPQISKAIDKLKAEGLIVPKPASYGKEGRAIRCEKGYAYANAYQQHANLPVIDYSKANSPAPRVPPLTPEQLRALMMPKKRK